MKIKDNLFIKLLCSIVLMATISGVGAGATGMAWMLSEQEVYLDRYEDTKHCRSRMEQDALLVSQYFDLEGKVAAGQELSAEERNEYDYLTTEKFLDGSYNFLWQLVDGDGNLLSTNVEEGKSLTQALGGNYQQKDIYEAGEQGDVVERRVLYGLRTGLPKDDSYAEKSTQFHWLRKMIVPVIIATGLCLLVSMTLFSYLMVAAGRKEGSTTVNLNPFDKVWLEPLLLLFSACIGALMYAISYAITPLIILMAILTGCGFVILSMSISRRAKAGRLFNTTLLCLLCRMVRALVSHIRETAWVIAGVAVYMLIQLMIVTEVVRGSFMACLIWIMVNLAVATLVVLFIVQYKTIRQATGRMADGNLDEVVDEKTVPFYADVARNLNRTGSAIRVAVEQATRSERMKTELITNVSHDIKTPLTSIISYVGLLRKTDIQDSRALEYIDVLEAKSKRLAQLMADLVEASKVTSGNVTVNLEPINLSELVKQAAGEFEARLSERNIQLMSRLPEQPMMVVADGRHMWRVLDNLFSNTVKYAMDGTRVYVDLAAIGEEAILSVKNVSRDPLNLRPDELMERFVQGDQSRHEEGSGLGLSIARSLMDLQHGRMDIQIDGDLFKVILYVKRVKTLPEGYMKPII